MISLVKDGNLKAEAMPLVLSFAGNNNIGSRSVGHARRNEFVIDEELDLNLLVGMLLTHHPTFNCAGRGLSPSLKMRKRDQKKTNRESCHQDNLNG
jgi:hypothetical protein